MLRASALSCLVLPVLSGITPLKGAEVAREARRPGDFAIIFQMGYAGDHFPKDPARFEKLLLAVKAAHYNTILCQHAPWREELCRKHGLMMMIDLLAPGHHVYKNAAGAKALCTSLRASDTIYAYHLWSDRVGGTIQGRNRDIANVHEWDPRHAVYLGDYNAREISGLIDPDLIGYYDFHWKRGGHWRHLLRARAAAIKTDSLFLKYVDGAPGKVGIGNYNRVLYTISMSVACGMKGYTFHHTGAEIDKGSWEWKTLGHDLSRVNAMIAPLGPELMKLGNPGAVYSTPMSKTAKNRPTGAEPAVPAEFEPIPAGAGFAVAGGEAVVGVYESPEKGRALVFANHNAYEPQKMLLKLDGDPEEAMIFDRKNKSWRRLALDAGNLTFEIPPAAAELVLIKGSAVE